MRSGWNIWFGKLLCSRRRCRRKRWHYTVIILISFCDHSYILFCDHSHHSVHIPFFETSYKAEIQLFLKNTLHIMCRFVVFFTDFSAISRFKKIGNSCLVQETIGIWPWELLKCLLLGERTFFEKHSLLIDVINYRSIFVPVLAEPSCKDTGR